MRVRVIRRWIAYAVLAAAAAPVAEPAELPPQIVERGTLRAVVTRVSGRNEFFTLGPSDRPGFDRELLEGFCRLHGLELEPVPVDGWDDLIPALLAGRGDLIAGRFTETPARSEKIDFTAQVFPTRNVVVTRRPHPAVTTAAALREVRVGTVAGSSLEEAIRTAGVPAARLDDGIPPGGLAEALLAGRVEAVVMGIEDAIVSRREDPELELGAFLGPPGSLAWGVRKEDEALRRALDEYIENTRRSIGWNRLVVSYFGSDAVEILRQAGER